MERGFRGDVEIELASRRAALFGRGAIAPGVVLQGLAAVLLALASLSTPQAARAYPAAGDRIFPATLLNPQIAPSDELYITPSYQPIDSGSVAGASDHLTNLSATYDKTITDALGVGATVGYDVLDRAVGGETGGWQNLQTFVQYLAVINNAHEFELSVGLNQEWGGSGTARVGAARIGATSPNLSFGKGFGDVSPAWLRPVAFTGTVAFQVADRGGRPNVAIFSPGIEYSIPYLQSKVVALDLPKWLRQVTPIVEMQFTTPLGNSHGQPSTGLIAPGLIYAGPGWELGAEALAPTSRASGTGVGAIVQLHLALDFFYPDSFGRPLVGSR
jgi:hypothetical protein